MGTRFRICLLGRDHLFGARALAGNPRPLWASGLSIPTGSEAPIRTFFIGFAEYFSFGHGSERILTYLRAAGASSRRARSSLDARGARRGVRWWSA